MPWQTSASEGCWPLYLDWCQATGRDPAHARLEEFFSQVPVGESTRTARQSAILARLGIEKPHKLDDRSTGPGPAWRSGQPWLGLHQALTQIPHTGWTSGLRGRRDAFLLVGISLGLTRTEAHRLTPETISTDPEQGLTIAERTVPTSDDPRSCPRCAVTRWLNTLGLYRKWGRAVVRAQLIRDKHAEQIHVCDQPVGEKEWRLFPVLLPGIDVHGWIDEYQGMSTRAVSAILAHRQAQSSSSLMPVAHAPAAHPVHYKSQRRDHGPGSFTRLDMLLDQMEEQAQAYLARIQRIEAEARETKRRASGA